MVSVNDKICIILGPSIFKDIQLNTIVKKDWSTLRYVSMNNPG